MSLPARMLVHPCDDDFDGCTLRREAFWQYFPNKTRASRQFGLVNILHGSFASKAVLKAWMSLKPKPSIPLGFVSLFQDNQHIFPEFESHQKRVSADWIILHNLTGSWKLNIAKEWIAERTILSIAIFPAEDMSFVDQLTALTLILSTTDENKSLFFRPKCSEKSSKGYRRFFCVDSLA